MGLSEKILKGKINPFEHFKKSAQSNWVHNDELTIIYSARDKFGTLMFVVEKKGEVPYYRLIRAFPLIDMWHCSIDAEGLKHRFFQEAFFKIMEQKFETNYKIKGL